MGFNSRRVGKALYESLYGLGIGVILFTFSISHIVQIDI